MKSFPLLWFCQALTALGASPAAWRSRSIYQVLTDRFARTDLSTSAPCNVQAKTYCGGTWRGIIEKLDYIQGMGFDAIWISPVTTQIDTNGAYHGYWQTDLYSVNSHFGTAADLKALSAAVHARGMYFMVGVVANHFASFQSDRADFWVNFNPFNKQEYFHPPCAITDYNNQAEVEDCWLGYNTAVELADLDTTRSDVKSAFQSWIKNLVSTYNIDGLRIDTVQFVQKDFWRPFNDAAGVYSFGEVADGRVDYVCPYQDVLDGLLNYPLFFAATNAFYSTSSTMSELVSTIYLLKQSCRDTTLMAPFLENHDQDRFPSLTSDLALDKNAIAFTMLFDGMPIIYQGQEQHYSGGADPDDREAVWLSGYNQNSDLYKYITMLNGLRRLAINNDAGYLSYQAFPIYYDDQNIAMRKGNNDALILSVLSNKGTGGNSYDLTIPTTGFSAGSKVTEVISCQQFTVDSSGGLTVPMAQGAPKLFYPSSKLSSALCASLPKGGANRLSNSQVKAQSNNSTTSEGAKASSVKWSTSALLASICALVF